MYWHVFKSFSDESLRGMDKILYPASAGSGPSSNATVTNDGATILKSVWIDNPAARFSLWKVDISKTQASCTGFRSA